MITSRTDAGEKPTVLVVDDAADNIELLQATLADTYRIKAATSGARALDSIRTEPPDIILLDVTMPEMDGYTVCRRLKSDPACAAIPVIFVTAADGAGDEELGFSLGAADYITKPFEPAVVRARVATHLALYDQTRLLESLVAERTRQLRHEMDQREQAIARIRYLHNYDSLTSLPGRRMLLQRIDTLVESHAGKLAVAVIDIDRFSAINDAVGTRLGDALLQQVSEALQHAAAGSDTIARLSGDAFGAVLLSDSSVVDRLHQVGESVQRLIESAQRHYDVGGDRVQVSLSVGIALHPSDGDTAEALLKSADAAMHVAKQSSATPYVFYDANMNAASRELVLMESELREAIHSGNIVPWYQPKLTTAGRQLVGAEGLARWQRADGKQIGPSTFIPLAEKTGLIKALNSRITHLICRQAKTWRDSYGEHLKFAVNLSAVDFQFPGLVDDLLHITRDTGVTPSAIELEITEHALVSDIAVAAEKIDALRGHGFTVALDDFGVGYSSLSYIQQFNIDVLKIDKSFMSNVGRNPRADAISVTLLTLAHQLNMVSVGEGVENEAQLAFLQHHHCKIVQGYLFSRAMPANDFEARLLR